MISEPSDSHAFHSVVDVEYKHAVVNALMARHPNESFVAVGDNWLCRETSIVSIVERVAEVIPNSRYRGLSNRTFLIESDEVVVTVDPRSSGRSTDVKKSIVAPIWIYAKRPVAEKIVAHVDATYTRHDRNVAQWWYMTDHGPDSTSVGLDAPTGICPELYPWLPNYAEFFRRYVESPIPLLFITGPPGTGKTTMLRSAIYNNRLSVSIAYDEALFKTDSMFIEFMTAQDKAVLIVEDADLIITSREHTGNKLISRFLNVSDGIIRFPNKKIIFTSNLRHFADIDSALTRQGRCFGVVEARELTFDEAKVAATAAGQPLPTEVRHDYTLAEIFNSNTKRHVAPRAGFL